MLYLNPCNSKFRHDVYAITWIKTKIVPKGKALSSDFYYDKYIIAIRITAINKYYMNIKLHKVFYLPLNNESTQNIVIKTKSVQNTPGATSGSALRAKLALGRGYFPKSLANADDISRILTICRTMFSNLQICKCFIYYTI